MHDLFLTSPIPPSVNHYIGYRGIMKHGKPMATSYKTQEAVKYAKEFSEYVISEVEKQGWDLEPNKSQHFYIDTVFYFPAVNLDANNYFKVLLDSITDTQKIWIDDNVTCERVQGIYYDSINPRVEIHIHPVDYIGVFKNEDEMKEFESHCSTCARYCRNCSVLRKAKEGRIQEEITNLDCKKYKEKRK